MHNEQRKKIKKQYMANTKKGKKKHNKTGEQESGTGPDWGVWYQWKGGGGGERV
jgi:hypothetical protein